MPDKAAKLLEQMRNSKSGWRPHDFRTLFEGFGFIMREGKNHTTYVHPDFPQLIYQIPRHNQELAKGYATDAVKLLDKLEQLRKEAK
jgi:hypothetical protein